MQKGPRMANGIEYEESLQWETEEMSEVVIGIKWCWLLHGRWCIYVVAEVQELIAIYVHTSRSRL